MTAYDNHHIVAGVYLGLARDYLYSSVEPLLRQNVKRFVVAPV
ncbi:MULTISPECIES: hypothetical protein [Shewanella]|nr:hypothetical protein [Shewanella glacialimarina]